MTRGKKIRTIYEDQPSENEVPSEASGDGNGVKNEKMRQIRKRKYSRDGCKECKRRKMKCDECKPFCHNCSRLNKDCEYEVKQKFRFENFGGDSGTAEPLNDKGGTKERKSLRKAAEKAHRASMLTFRYNVVKNGVSNVPRNENSNMEKEEKPSQSKTDPFTTMSYPLGSIQESQSPLESSNGSKPGFKNAISDILSPSKNDTSVGALDFDNLDDAQRLLYDASLLVNDMNELVATDMQTTGQEFLHFDSHIPHIYDTPNSDKEKNTDSGSESFDRKSFQIDDFKNKVRRYGNLEEPESVSSLSEVDLYVSNVELINEIIKNNQLSGIHITYLNVLVQTNLSYHLFPFASSIESNEVVKILLHYSKNCPYLLSSLLAISSTFQFNQTGKATHDLARQKYVSACLKLLSEVFSNNGSIHHNLANNIERLLFTVLVLSSNFTSTSYNNKDNVTNSWKVHLKGAQDLFIKFSRITKQNGLQYVSSGLALAKTWFFAIESVAGLSSFQGGATAKTPRAKSASANGDSEGDEKTIVSYELYDDAGNFSVETNPRYHDALVQLRLLISDRRSTKFNIYLGFSIEVVALMREVIRGLDYIRSGEGKFLSSSRIAKIFSLIHHAKQTEIVPHVDKETFVIPTFSQAHPDFEGNRVVLPPSAYAKQQDELGNTTYYSWFDLSEQLHIDLVYLKLLTSKGMLQLPRNHPLVQDVLKRILGAMIFVKPKSSPGYRKDIALAETENLYTPTSLFDIRCIMVQSPFILCSKFVQSDEEFEKLELFFSGLVKLGNGSALSALDNLFKYRERRRQSESSANYISEEDIMQDTESIPFA